MAWQKKARLADRSSRRYAMSKAGLNSSTTGPKQNLDQKKQNKRIFLSKIT